MDKSEMSKKKNYKENYSKQCDAEGAFTPVSECGLSSNDFF